MTKEDVFNHFTNLMLVRRARSEVIFFDEDKNVIFLNPTAHELHSIPAKEEGGEIPQIEELYDEQSCKKLHSVLDRISGLREEFLQLSFYNKEKQRKVFVDCRVTHFLPDDSKPDQPGYALVGNDITSLVLTREELNNQRNFLNAVIENAQDGIVLINDQGTIQSVNRAAADLFGYEMYEMPGQNIKMLMPSTYSRKHDEYLKNYQKTGIAKIIGRSPEVNGKRRDGSLFPIRLSINELKFGEESYYTGLVHDLSEQKRIEEELKNVNRNLEMRVRERTEELAETVNRLLKEVNERKAAVAALKEKEKITLKSLEKERELSDLKSRFITMASHEFRTPLSAIKLSSTIIKKYNEKGTQDDRVLKHLDRINANVETVTNILTDFLSVSRLEEGKLENNPQEFNLEEFVKDVLNELESYRREGQNISYKHSGAQTDVCLDESLLKNILTNLVSNAVKYSKTDSNIFIETVLSSSSMRLIVKDEGVGIPEKEQKFLFNRFFRASNVSHIQGTGLGLNLVRQYVDLMGGIVTIASEEGVGTTISANIPIKS